MRHAIRVGAGHGGWNGSKELLHSALCLSDAFAMLPSGIARFHAHARSWMLATSDWLRKLKISVHAILIGFELVHQSEGDMLGNETQPVGTGGFVG